MPDPSPKPEPAKTDWLKLVGPLFITAGLIFVGWRGVPPIPAIPGIPSTIEKPAEPPIKPTIADSIAKRNGIRNDASKEPLVKLIESGAANYMLHFQPDGKPEVVWTVTVTGGDKPAPLPPPKPDEPLPQPPPAPVDPNLKVTSVTYFYEKDQGGVPNHVSTALNKINRDSGFKITAATFEDDSTNGGGQVPKQYKTARDAALALGLPAIVATNGDAIVKSIKTPKTEAEILEVVK